MAKLKYDQERRIPTEYSDFRSAMVAQTDPPPFTIEEVYHLAACYPGEADGEDWVWIVQVGSERFYGVTGWCDYTGWGCQDGGSMYGPCATEDEVLALLTAETPYKPELYENLRLQLRGDAPYGLKDGGI